MVYLSDEDPRRNVLNTLYKEYQSMILDGHFSEKDIPARREVADAIYEAWYATMGPKAVRELTSYLKDNHDRIQYWRKLLDAYYGPKEEQAPPPQKILPYNFIDQVREIVLDSAKTVEERTTVKSVIAWSSFYDKLDGWVKVHGYTYSQPPSVQVP